jgi:WD40 repeat protein
MLWSVAVGPDGKHVLSGASETAARLWDLRSGKELRRFDGKDGRVRCVAFSRDGRRAVFCTEKTLQVWDVEKGEELSRFDVTETAVHAAAYSPDSRHVASGDGTDDGGGLVRVWDLETAKPRDLKGHTQSISTIAFSPDGQRILSGSHDKTVRLWNSKTGRELRVLEGHENWVESVAFSPDSARALSASRDGTVRLWDLDTGRELARVNAHADGALCVAFLPDGKHVVSGGGDGVVRFWRVRR